MSLTLWHRQFRNPIFLVLWTSYPGVQLVTFAAVSLCGGATRCMNISVQISLFQYTIDKFPEKLRRNIKQYGFHPTVWKYG